MWRTTDQAIKFLSPSDISGNFPNCNHCNELLLSDSVSCGLLNNSSEHGACTGPNECTCEKGYQGANCSEGIEYCCMIKIRRDSHGSNDSDRLLWDIKTVAMICKNNGV